MANNLKINPATDGSNDSRSMERVAAVLNDSLGDDITSTNPLPISNFSALISESYDSIELTYVASGNGAGEIETVVYKKTEDTVATLTLSYNAGNKLIGVVKS